MTLPEPTARNYHGAAPWERDDPYLWEGFCPGCENYHEVPEGAQPCPDCGDDLEVRE